MTSANSPQVLASFLFVFEADFARLRLELEGIRARLADDAAAGWFWHYSNAIGGVKVLVRAEDLPAALQILGRDNGLPSPGPHAPQQWLCAGCGTRVTPDFQVCWACGTSSEGQSDPGFERADALPVVHDFGRLPAFWWPILYLFWPPLFIYDALWALMPERGDRPRKRPRTFVAIDPRLTVACRMAIYAVAFFPGWLWLLPSFWLLASVDLGCGPRRRRSRIFVALAMILYSLLLLTEFLPLGIITWHML
jgi:hypothetical protein